MFVYDFPQSLDQEHHLLEERVRVFRALPSLVKYLKEQMLAKHKEEQAQVEQYTSDYCEWRRVLKKQQKTIEEQEVKAFGQQAFKEFLRLSDKAGNEKPRYRQVYQNQASSKRSFYCPVKHAE